MPTTYTTHHGEMIDAICRRAYGDESGFVEAVLEENPGLASLPAPLPEGTRIILPDVPKAAARVTIVNLWD